MELSIKATLCFTNEEGNRHKKIDFTQMNPNINMNNYSKMNMINNVNNNIKNRMLENIEEMKEKDKHSIDVEEEEE